MGVLLYCPIWAQVDEFWFYVVVVFVCLFDMGVLIYCLIWAQTDEFKWSFPPSASVNISKLVDRSVSEFDALCLKYISSYHFQFHISLSSSLPNIYQYIDGFVTRNKFI